MSEPNESGGGWLLAYTVNVEKNKKKTTEQPESHSQAAHVLSRPKQHGGAEKSDVFSSKLRQISIYYPA